MWKELWKWKSGREESETREIITNQYFWNTCLVDKLKLARKNKNSSTSGCQRATGKGECGEVYGNCCLWEIIASCSYLLGGSTVKYLVEGPGSLLDNRASIWVDETNAEEDKLVPANILCMFITVSDYNDLLRVMASASILPSKFHAVLVNSNLVP